jgi:DNA repair protein RecO (recombination protein O)
VLRTQQLGEADLIVSLLAEQHGRVRAVARAARKSRKRFGGLLEPLTRVGATWSEKEGRELHRLDALEAVRSFAPMQAEPVLQATCAVLAELSEAFARDGHSEGRTFRLLGAVLDSIENGAEPLTVVRYFEYWTLRLHGLMPELTTCSLCSAALPAAEPVRVVRRQGILCRTCQAAPARPASSSIQRGAVLLPDCPIAGSPFDRAGFSSRCCEAPWRASPSARSVPTDI